MIKLCRMSREFNFKNHQENNVEIHDRQKVRLTDLMSRLNEEKKRERNSNIAFSVAAVAAVSVFGIILSL